MRQDLADMRRDEKSGNTAAAAQDRRDLRHDMRDMRHDKQDAGRDRKDARVDRHEARVDRRAMAPHAGHR